MMLRCENGAVQSIILDMADLEGLAGLEEQRTSTRTRERTMDSNRDMSVNSQDSAYSDVKITDEEDRKLKEIFNEFDRDGNGTISKSELRQAFQCRGMNPTMRDCKKWIEEVDTDAINNNEKICLVVRALGWQMDPNGFITRLLTTGWIRKFTFRKTGMMHKYVYTGKGDKNSLTYEEFKILTYRKWCEALENEDAEFDKAFAVLDVDGSGKLDPVEFKNLVTNNGEDRLTDEEVDYLLEMADKDDDGLINKEELKGFFLSLQRECKENQKRRQEQQDEQDQQADNES